MISGPIQVLIGILLFPVFCWYEMYTDIPIIPYKFLRNRSILAACLIGKTRAASFTSRVPC